MASYNATHGYRKSTQSVVPWVLKTPVLHGEKLKGEKTPVISTDFHYMS